MSSSRPRILPILLLPLLLLPGLAIAANHVWPGAAPCNGTLQACVDAALDGDRIEIATNTPITSDLSMHNRRLTLRAADGYKPVFEHAGVLANSTGSSGDISLHLSRIRFVDGWITVTHVGSGTATFDLRELEMSRTPGTSGNAIQVIAYGGTVEAMLYDNRISGAPAHSTTGLVALKASGGTLNATAYYNHVTANAAEVEGAGFFVDYAGSGSDGMLKLHANEVRGDFRRAGVYVSEGLGSSAPTSFSARLYSNVVVGSGSGTGISIVPKDGSIAAQLFNNTITRVRNGVMYMRWSGGTSATITGLLFNNLVRASQISVFGSPGISADVTGNPANNGNNLLNGPTINFSPGTGTITAPAALFSDELPRLTAASPALDAADTGRLGLGLIFNMLPVTDADGLRRIKKPTPDTAGTIKADIGAYEYGDHIFTHTTQASNISNHITWLNDDAVNGQSAVNLFATPNFDLGLPGSSGVANPNPFGIWKSGSAWSLFNEDTSVAMPVGAHFDVFSAAPGSGVLRHVATAENTAGRTTQLADSSLDNKPDRIVLATQNYSAGPKYNRSAIGVFYFGLGGTGSWYVANLDDGAADLPVGAGFSVYAQEPSPNAFRAVATAANRPGSAVLYLDHPLLNDTPCARPVATRIFDGAPTTTGVFDMDYRSGRWTIFTYSDIPLGASFNVLVDPAQVANCRDRLFADGFD